MKAFKIKLTIILSLLILCFITYKLFQAFDVTLKAFAETTGRNYICEMINECILISTEKLSAEYGSICNIHHNSAGKITAIIINPESVNRLKAETVSEIIRSIKDNEKETFQIPLGTLMGSRFFSAKGPDIKIDVIPLGAVSSELVQKFTAVGINQTMHSIYLDVRISVILASPFSSAPIDVSTKVCIAENVIIGDIPFIYSD